MAAPLCQDLRRRIVRAVETGASAREAARRFAVSPSAAVKIVRRARETGSTAPARIRGYRGRLLAGQEDLPRDLAEATPGVHARGDPDGAGRAGRAGGLADHDLGRAAPARARAQRKSLRASQQDRPDVATDRRRWRVWQRYMDPERSVFLDGSRRCLERRGDEHDPPPRPPVSGKLSGAWT